MTNEPIKHYGVPGMKWGVRKRYQSYKKYSSEIRISTGKQFLSLFAPRKLNTLSDKQIEKGVKVASGVMTAIAAVQFVALASELAKP